MVLLLLHAGLLMGKIERPTLRKVSLDDKYTHDHDTAYMTGIEALVRLPILQRQRDSKRGLNTAGFVSGYRGSPLGGVDQAMWKAATYLDAHHIHFQPGVNEDLCLLYTSPSPRDVEESRMPSSA